jgi:predicted naringenin-chalcone synthase
MASLSHFHSIRPPYETKQEDTFEWLIDAHAQSKKTAGASESEVFLFREEIRKKFWHVGCKPDRIEKRGHILNDFLHRDWDKMEVYRLNQFPAGCDLSVRMLHFESFVDGVFESYYPDGASPPDDIIHVSCTGYISPSGAQKIVSKRGWGSQATVTHAYHMGCYGAFPAIRMGSGFLKSGKKQIDIVHTEICSLHSNPSLHQTDQLVSQSLFADGFMKYTLSEETGAPHLKTLGLHEEILPDSIESMTWNVVSWGNALFLSKEIPVLIARSLKGYLKNLCEKASLPESILEKAMFAIHPGGPKILNQIQERLKVTDAQIAPSFEILKKFGNISSATIPHVWDAILKNPEIETLTPVVSMAFGPGLSISGSIMVKVCGS